MDKELLIKLLAGTILRGLIWVVGFVSAKTAIDAPDEEALAKVGYWAAAVAVALLGIIWSMVKNSKLLKTPT